MARVNAPLFSFNRGEVAKAALGRVDLERMRLSAETQLNWLPTPLGPMMLRPGLKYIGGIYGDLTCRLIPFIFANSDTALLECTNGVLRVWNVASDVETLVARPAVTSVVTNGNFSSSVGWTLTMTGSGASATIGSGVLTLASPAAGGLAQAKRSVTIVEIGTEHAFRIEVTRGPVIFRCGTTDGNDNVIEETTLDTGTHSLGFTTLLAGTVYIQLETRTAQSKIVDSITFEAAGVLALPTTWDTDDLPYLRFSQSGDIVYVACKGQQQRKIERRSTRSWSFVLYKSDDGPFGSTNLTDTTLTAGALSGNTTLTASRDYFRSTHVGALIRLFTAGQRVSTGLAAQNTFTSAIRVSGVGSARVFALSRSGTWVGTITLQRSFDSATTGFQDTSSNYASNGVINAYDDGLNNSIVWYRLGFKTGEYTSGTATLVLDYGGGGAPGIARVTGYTSKTVVDVEVLTPFSNLDPSSNWTEGDWSARVGWPSAVRFYDGRLWWAGRDRIWGSVSDAYNSFDIDHEGDAGPINRSVGFGPVDNINWLLDLGRLIVGREGAETSIRSGSQDEPLTPTNFTLKDCSTQGSAAIGAVKVDARGIFVQQSGRRVYALTPDPDVQDYAAHDLTRLNPDIGTEGFSDLAVQRQPDTQVHFVRGDGLVAVLTLDSEDQVEAWWRIETAGEIESVAVLPGTQEDNVYFSVKRTVNGSVKRFLEKLARRDQCSGLPGARHADAHIIYHGVATSTITGLAHLEGETVTVWGWNDSDTEGKDLGTFTVTGAQITGLAQTVQNACVGPPYAATFKSSKLAYAAQKGSALTQKKKINQLGLILLNTHAQGIEFGQNFTRMDRPTLIRNGAAVGADTMHAEFDGPMVPVPGNWDTDARLCLRATAPRPCTVMAAVIDITTHE
jgi:hypothetical protein